MGRGANKNKDFVDLDEMIEQITADAYSDDEMFQAFYQVLNDKISLPIDGFVIGEPVSVVAIEYGGNARRGLTARCRRDDGSEHVVAATEVTLREGSVGSHFLSAYRRWLDSDPAGHQKSMLGKKQHKATADDLDLTGPVHLVALSIKERTATCRLLESQRVVTLRATGVWQVVPGAIITVTPRKQWRYAGHPYLSGEMASTRLDAAALGLVPLKLKAFGLWDPTEHYWGEEDEPIEEWAKPIIAFGPRPQFEMEQVLPGQDPDDPWADPIIESNNLKEAGDYSEAEKILMELCRSDLRCLDAHVHLGNLVFDHRPEDAIPHYEIGMRIGELSLGHEFNGVLPWGLIDNRPFLRCMHGYGSCAWRLGRFEEALKIFSHMLWMNPSDNQGVRFLIEDVGAKRSWEETQ